jgi:hypothetical protein
MDQRQRRSRLCRRKRRNRLAPPRRGRTCAEGDFRRQVAAGAKQRHRRRANGDRSGRQPDGNHLYRRHDQSRVSLARVATPGGNYFRHGLTDWLASRYAGPSRSRTVRRLRRAGRRVLSRLSEASTPSFGVAGGACRSARSSPTPRAHSARSDFRCSRKGAGSGYRHLGGTASCGLVSEAFRTRRLISRIVASKRARSSQRNRPAGRPRLSP